MVGKAEGSDVQKLGFQDQPAFYKVHFSHSSSHTLYCRYMQENSNLILLQEMYYILAPWFIPSWVEGFLFLAESWTNQAFCVFLVSVELFNVGKGAGQTIQSIVYQEAISKILSFRRCSRLMQDGWLSLCVQGLSLYSHLFYQNDGWLAIGMEQIVELIS